MNNTISVPGPGSYDVEDPVKFNTAPAPKFGHEDRFLKPPLAGQPPGPGQYNFDNLDKIKQSSPNFAFG